MLFPEVLTSVCVTMGLIFLSPFQSNLSTLRHTRLDLPSGMTSIAATTQQLPTGLRPGSPRVTNANRQATTSRTLGWITRSNPTKRPAPSPTKSPTKSPTTSPTTSPPLPSSVTFFQSPTFLDLYQRTQTQRMALLVNDEDTRKYGVAAIHDASLHYTMLPAFTAPTDTNTATDTSTGNVQTAYLLPGRSSDDRKRLLRSWSNHLIRAAPLPSTLTESAYHARLDEVTRNTLANAKQTVSDVIANRNLSNPNRHNNQSPKNRRAHPPRVTTFTGAMQTFSVRIVRSTARSMEMGPLGCRPRVSEQTHQ